MMSLKKNTEIESSPLCSRVVLLGSGAAVVYIAVALVFHPQGLDQFVIPKIMVLLVGAPVILGLLVAGKVVAPRDPLLIALVAVFFGWSVVAPLASSQNKVLHGCGALEATLMGVVFLGALGSRRAGTNGEQWLVRLLALPAVVIAPLAVMQALGIDPLRLVLGLGSTRSGRWQVLTTQGNPSWTAELVVLSLPFVLLACSGLGRWRKTGAVVAGVVLVAAVMATGSRGGMLGIVVAGVVGLRLGLITLSKRTRWLSVVTALVVGLVLVFGNFGRLIELRPLTGRLGLWAAGIHLASEKPVVGLGLRHVYLVLPDGLEEVVAETDPERRPLLSTLIVDRLDQDLLQVAVERGVPATLLLLLIWGWAAKGLVGHWRETRSPLDGATVIFLFVFGVVSLFSAPFHTPSTSVLFWFAIGVAAAGRPPVPIGVSGVRLGVSGGVGLVLALIVWLGVAVPVFQDNATAGTAHKMRVRGQVDTAAGILEPITGRAPWLPGAAIDRAGALVDLGRASEALVVIEEAELWAQSEWFWALRARALDQLGLRDEARRELERGFKVLPRSPLLLEVQADLGLDSPHR